MRLGGQPARPGMWEVEAFQQLLGGGQHIVTVSGQLPCSSVFPTLTFQERGVKGHFMVLFRNSVDESIIRTI